MWRVILGRDIKGNLSGSKGVTMDSGDENVLVCHRVCMVSGLSLSLDGERFVIGFAWQASSSLETWRWSRVCLRML